MSHRGTVPGKEKPCVPPKPKHLVFRTSTLPKPPDNVLENIQDVLQTMQFDDIQKCSREDYYGDDGYLKPVTNTSLVKRADGTSPQESAQHVSHSWRMKIPSKNRAVKLEDFEVAENSSVRDVRQRPLPLLPGEKVQSIVGMPWFSPVDRRKAEHLVKNGIDGCFLIRPSSKGQTSLALTLWYRGRPYNIPIRKRSDGNYALGTPKDLEQSFTTIEEMVLNYQREELILYSNGVETGRTTIHPLHAS